MSTSVLLCDLDGTLVDSFADIRRGVTRALEAVGGSVTPELTALSTRGISLELFYGEAFGAAASEPSERDRFNAFVGSYRSLYFDDFESQAYDGVQKTLRDLRARRPGMPVAVATTKRTDMAARVVRLCGLDDLVDHVLGSDNLPKKPDPALLRAAAAKAGADIGGAVMVGDTDNDILAAHAAGCRSVAVTYGGWSADEIGGLGASFVIDAFEELSAILR